MAANNYYGFAHGGTQYANTYNPANGGQPPAYPGQYVPGAPNVGPGAADQQYMLQGYARPVGAPQGMVKIVGAAPVAQYYGQGGPDAYSQGMADAQKVANAGARPATTSTVYPTYSANTAGNAATSYAGFAPPAPAGGGNPGGNLTNYDKAVYSAVSQYAHGGHGGRGGGGGMGYGKRPQGNKGMKGVRPPPKPQALHYCDVCKISCAGPQTYKEHLDGQKHKKKEAAAQAGTPVVAKGSPPGLRCELCDVTCTGQDAYAAHIRGAKHQKVIKLYSKLGKPIPSDSPTLVSSAGSGSTAQSPAKPAAAVNSAPSAPAANGSMKPPTPKINFLGPKTEPMFGTTNNAKDFSAPVPGTVTTPATMTTPALTTSVNVPAGETASLPPIPKDDHVKNSFIAEKDVQPVGHDYIEEVKNDEGKIVSFNCKLCECRFNDPNAKDMHMKGRRHRLQFKKKVNPDLIVDIKPSSRQKKLDERRARTVAPPPMGRRLPMGMPEGYPRGPPAPLIPANRGYAPPSFHSAPPVHSPYYIPPLIRRTETLEDAHVMARHTEIYPDEQELQAIQKIVSNSEKALKCVSDQFAEEDSKAAKAAVEGTTEKPSEAQTGTTSEAELQAHRILKGVMRVGNLAKGLLLKGDRNVQLVVLCSQKPTLTMLNRVMEYLPAQLKLVAPEDTYEVIRDVSGSSVVVSSLDEPRVDVSVTLTSPILRSAPGDAAVETKEDPDLLDKDKCLQALAALRHAKWFQARAAALQSCVIMIRVFRDMCARIPEWEGFPHWAIELLVEKIISSIGNPVSPGDALRYILEAISSGILLSNSIGLMDPCEKEDVDAFGSLTEQQRNDVTAFCQKALRLLAFRKIHEVLGMDSLAKFRKSGVDNSRKRRRIESEGGEGDEGDSSTDGTKKDKKDDIVEEKMQEQDLTDTTAAVVKLDTESVPEESAGQVPTTTTSAPATTE